VSHRKVRIISKRRRQPDYRKLSRALLELAAAQIEADAQAAHQAKPTVVKNKTKPEHPDAG
jgi:hypothetical protein